MTAVFRSFDALFLAATGHNPYDYQRRMAADPAFPDLLRVPTGAGKTAAVVLSWLWRRRFAPETTRNATPRRLVYCLPMRVLVEQTYECAVRWLSTLGLPAGAAPGGALGGDSPTSGDRDGIDVSVLMGGEARDEWDVHPERDAVLIGTQDMLLSRALCRGYGCARARWPLHMGMLSNDCLWVIDEPQLFGCGLATTAQLAAFRRGLGVLGPARTIWMSATLDPAWLTTVDFEPERDAATRSGISAADRSEENLARRLLAWKPVARARASAGDAPGIAAEVLETHRPGTRTLVVVNQVKRAAALYAAITSKAAEADVVLVHSRFRPGDRRKVVRRALAQPGASGTIVISTQVIEAGVDLSARVLFTEVAPWASLVQRFGRCNREGRDEDALVRWIDIPPGPTGEKLAPPYAMEELGVARAALQALADAGSAALPELPMRLAPGHVLRRKDLIELFDTTPDLAGADIDVSRFIREPDDHDVSVLWRDLGEEGPDEDAPAAAREELCPAPIGEVRDLLMKKKLSAWIYDALDGAWTRARVDSAIYPGVVLLLRSADGGYTREGGWTVGAKTPVPASPTGLATRGSGYDADRRSEARRYETLAEHTDKVVAVATAIADAVALSEPLRTDLLRAARVHDLGKAHAVFQRSMREAGPEGAPTGLLAKTAKPRIKHARKHFRHELASGVLALQHGERDLVAYLAAAHHGKVRLSLRSMPDEHRPLEPDRPFARGIWHGDLIPADGAEVDLGGGARVPATRVDLSYMELGEGPHGPSWLARMLSLRDDPDLGPFRLAYLEALIKAADERASGGVA